MNHGIVSTYLSDAKLRTQVLTKLITAAQLLESNCPKAIINYTKNNLQIDFNSIDPSNPNINDLIYIWNFGDDKNLETTSKTLSHTYTNEGKYTVTLTIKDKLGNQLDSTTKEIVIQQTVPNRLVYYFANRDVTFGFEGPLTTSGIILSYNWDFGDGSKSDAADVMIIHKYNNEGASPTSILGFIAQQDFDPTLGRCYIKSFNTFNYNGQVCVNLYNCSSSSLIP